MLKSINRFLNKVKKDPDGYLIALLVFLLPFERIPSWEFHGITLRPNLFISGLVILLAAYRLLKKQVSWKSKPARWLVLFLGWLVVLVPFSTNRARAIEVVVFTLFVALSAIGVALLLKKEHLLLIERALIASVILVTLFGLYQYFGDIYGLSTHFTALRERYTWQLFGFPRIQSTALEPLYFANYLLLPIAFLASKILTGRNTKWTLGLFTLTTLNLFLTVSRGGNIAVLAVVIAAPLLMLITKTRGAPKSIIKVALLTAVSLITALLLINYWNKPASSSGRRTTGLKSYTRQVQTTGLEGSGDERAGARRAAFKLLKSHPFTGVGPGNFGVVVTQNHKPGFGWPIVNNETLELAAETGLVGFVLFMVFVFSLLRSALSKARQVASSVDLKLWVIALTAFLVGATIQYQTFSTLYIVHVWAAIGLLMGLSQINRRAA